MIDLEKVPQLFQTGQLVSTPGALDLMEQIGVSPMELLSRHITGDWGDMSQEDLVQNSLALKYGDGRIFSSYRTAGGKIWIITEADRSSTCILLPDEY